MRTNHQCFLKSLTFFTFMGLLIFSVPYTTHAQGGPPPQNPGQPFDQILSQLNVLQTQIVDIQAIVGNLSIQHDNFETAIENIQTAINDLTVDTDLSGVPPTWDKLLPANDGDTTSGREGCDSSRFKCVMGDLAVLDEETGLVWDRTPSLSVENWFSALTNCANGTHLGSRKGWRLPSFHELASLPLTPPGGLPSGHPFIDVQAGGQDKYWTATTVGNNSDQAWVVGFESGDVDPRVKTSTFLTRAWCVRGGGPISEY